MKEEIEILKGEIREIKHSHSLCWKILQELKKEKNQLIFINAILSIALIVSIVGILFKG